MGTESKTYVCVVFHHSDLRPEGLQMAQNFCQSWKKYNLPFSLMVLDNQSTCQFDCLDGIDHTFIRVDDQIAGGGITGAWNTLCREAIAKGAEVITGFADDVQVNDSLIKLIDSVQDDNTVYAPLTDGMHNAWLDQKANSIRPGFTKVVNSINGFWMAFTKQFWLDKNIDGDLFIFSKKPFIDQWAGQELMMEIWHNKFNTQALIVGDCWIHHTKVRSWKKARQKFNN